MSISCALSILVARTDVPFMMHTIPHLVRSCNFPFSQRVLVVDIAPLGPEYRNRPGIGSLEDLRSRCEQLIATRVVDEAIEIDYSDTYRDRMYNKHFSNPLRHTHNYRGYPILGSIFAIEESNADYVVHFDSDMLLYQHENFNWIANGIELISKHKEIVSVLPLSGPPTHDGDLKQQEKVGEPYERDRRGFYRFKTFTSRVFLVNRSRFDGLLPLSIPLPQRALLENYTTRINTIPPWEEMISKKLELSPFIRVDLNSSLAWTLHPEDHGPEFVNALPDIIQKVELGWYPPRQAGYYDLQLMLWK